MREVILFKTIAFLNGKGFEVTSFLGSNSCFDLIARRGSECFMVKVYSNVDSFRKEQAEELKKLSRAFSAIALIVGEKSKLFSLKQNTVYERHSLPVMNLQTFFSVFDSSIPAVHSFKGKTIVELDAEKLKEKRRELDLTLSELSKKTGLSRESLYRFEHGYSTSVETAKKLERALGAELIAEKNLIEEFLEAKPKKEKGFEFDESLKDDVLEKMHDMGLNLLELQHSPFHAVGEKNEWIVIDKGKEKQELKKKVLVLEKAKAVLNAHSLIITKKYKLERISSTPVIQEEELNSYRKINELLEEIKKRERKK